MVIVTLNCENMLRRKEVHAYLAQMFGFPEYYGNNLDALFDCLTELPDCTVVLEGSKILTESGTYGAKILKVMKEAAEANSGLQLTLL